VGIFDWKYTASDLADWFDEKDEKYWRDHDEWLIQSQNLGNASPVVVFAAWYNDRLGTIGQRAQSALAGSIFDVLRLGNDFDFDSALGVGKGTFLNLTRLATIAGPVSEALGVAGRYAGIVATSKLTSIPGSEGPCVYVAVNNVLSLFKGRPIQLFATVEDIVAVGGSASEGTTVGTLLTTSKVQAMLEKMGITVQKLGGMKTIDDVLRAAKAADGPIVFSVEWPSEVAGVESHALTAAKDARGIVRILDYVEEVEGGGTFKGFASMDEMIKARVGGWGEKFAEVKLIQTNPVRQFSGRYLRLLSFVDHSYSFGIPVGMGMRWLRGNSPEDKIFDMARSVWRFVRGKNASVAPTPQEPSVLPDIPDDVPTIPSTPDQAGKRLGVAPLPSEARGAPRIDWLTGVQYRLKYLGYYRGAVTGTNDQQTKNAVMAFQKEWFDDASQWDAIPGPITQGALYAALGW